MATNRSVGTASRPILTALVVAVAQARGRLSGRMLAVAGLTVAVVLVRLYLSSRDKDRLVRRLHESLRVFPAEHIGCALHGAIDEDEAGREFRVCAHQLERDCRPP